MFLSKRQFVAKDGTPLYELMLLDLENLKVIRNIISVSIFSEIIDDSNVDPFSDEVGDFLKVYDLELSQNGFSSMIKAIRYIGTLDIKIKKN